METTTQVSKYHYKELQKLNRTLTHLNLLLIHYNVKTTSSKHLFCLKITLQKRFILKRQFTIGCRFCPLSKNSNHTKENKWFENVRKAACILCLVVAAEYIKFLPFFNVLVFFLYSWYSHSMKMLQQCCIFKMIKVNEVAGSVNLGKF